MRPSGAQTIDHGTSRLPTTVSTLNFVCVWGELSISPAPRPGAGRLQESAIAMRTVTRADTIIFHFSFFINRVSRQPSLRYVVVQQSQFVALFADFNAQQVTHGQHA